MVQVGSGQFIPGFEDNLIGLGVGEHKEFEVAFPADYQVEELRDKPAAFAVDVKEIKEKVVPELSDDFAKDVSEFETLEELKADVRERLQKMQTTAAEREFRSLAVDEAVANSSLAVPPAMVEREAHGLYHDLESSVGEQGLTMDVYLKAMEKTPAEVEEELKPRAEMNVRRRLVLDAIREAEGIEVTDDEVRERIKADAVLLERDPDQLVIDVYASGRHGMIRDELLMAKTVDFLVEQAVPVEIPAADEESDGADADAGVDQG
jgi:trigger factor